MDQGSYVPPPTEPGTPDRPARRPLFGSGWPRALGHAVLTVLLLGVVAELIAFLLYITANRSRPSPVLFARLGGVFFFAFHHVGMLFNVPRVAIPPGFIPGAPAGQFPTNVGFRFTAIFPLLGGTVLLLLLMIRAGRDLAQRSGAASVWARGLEGAKVGVPYGVLCFVAAWGVRFSIPTPQGRVSIHPSLIASLLWPLGLGLLFGAIGGLRSAHDTEWSVNPWWRRARGAVAGGGRMMTLALVFSFAGLLVLAAVKPGDTARYFHGIFGGGALRGIALIAAQLLIVPNMATFVLFPAMGTCLTASARVIGPNFSFCVLSYTQFPRTTGARAAGLIPSGALPNPPIGYYAFILAPLLAVVLGGMLAARRGGAETRQEAVGLGAVAGFVFGLGTLLAVILSAISANGTVSAAVAAQSQSFDGSLRLGPDLLPGMLLGFAWGILGGGIGGLIEGRSRPTAVAPAGPAWESTAPLPPPA